MTAKKKNMGIDWVERIDLSIYSVPEGKGKYAVWQAIFEKIDNHNLAKSTAAWRVVSMVAAVFVGLALIGSLTWVVVFGRTAIYSPAGQHLSVVLPDGSSVNLNAETQLSFNRVLWYFSRNVDLEGEALFTVTKGNTFNVKTGVVTTQVLGTTFNVYARNNEVKVNCIEGSVAVIHSLTKQRVRLSSSQKTSLSDGNLDNPVDLPIAEMALWINGEFYYFNQSLDDVLLEVGRQFNVSIKKDFTTKRFYTGVFFSRELSEALDLVCIPMQLKWEKLNGTIIISEQNSKDSN